MLRFRQFISERVDTTATASITELFPTLAFNLKFKEKVHFSNGKIPLRNILKKLLPQKLISKNKRGFGIPLNNWLREELRDWSEDLISRKNINEYENVSNVLINIGGRIGNLMDITQEAINPKSNEGSNITELEKQKIFKAILEVEEKISKLKLSIK